MPLAVYGNYGSPLLMFPTAAADFEEYERFDLIDSIAHHIDSGRIKVFTINSINRDSWMNNYVHPADSATIQVQFDRYIAEEVVPFIWNHCQTQGIAITTMGASFGAYHAANSLFKHPDVIKRCFAMSGVYDLRNFMEGMYDDNFYFNNPVDYLSNASDPWFYQQIASCDIHLSTGTGPWENSGPTYRLSEVLSGKGIRHSLDNWGPQGGHDWPYWKHQMREYISKLF